MMCSLINEAKTIEINAAVCQKKITKKSIPFYYLIFILLGGVITYRTCLYDRIRHHRNYLYAIGITYMVPYMI